MLINLHWYENESLAGLTHEYSPSVIVFYNVMIIERETVGCYFTLSAL